MTQSSDMHVLPLVEEQATITKEVLHERVSIKTTSESYDEVVRETLRGERVEITRVPIEREVKAPPPVRTEENGALVIVPVLEERLTVVKTLILTEELHIRRQVTSEVVEIPITLRKQNVSVSSNPSDPTSGRGQT